MTSGESGTHREGSGTGTERSKRRHKPDEAEYRKEQVRNAMERWLEAMDKEADKPVFRAVFLKRK